MQIVNIKDALWYGKPVHGNFPLVSVRDGDANCQREVYLRIIKNGKEVNVHANRADYKIVEDTNQPVVTTAEEQLDATIARRFEIMAKLTEFVVKGDVRSMIISGAAGIGKSYNLETRLNKAIDNSEINQFTILKGKISAIALFAQLFEHRNKGDILVLDDIDVIFQDETSLNLLKGALDTGDKRHLVWLTASDWLEEQGVDQAFDFEGACVFITNMDFDRMMERGTNLAPHFKALISRSIYLDLAIHTNKEILTRIKQVVNTTTMLDVHGIDNHQKGLMMTWMEDHYENLRELSLRTILKLASFMNGDPQGWQDIAEATMVRNSPFNFYN
jgi:DNA replication protein DnaC